MGSTAYSTPRRWRITIEREVDGIVSTVSRLVTTRSEHEARNVALDREHRAVRFNTHWSAEIVGTELVR